MFKPLDQNNENEIKLKENENNNVIEVAINHIVTRGDEIKHEKKRKKKKLQSTNHVRWILIRKKIQRL